MSEHAIAINGEGAGSCHVGVRQPLNHNDNYIDISYEAKDTPVVFRSISQSDAITGGLSEPAKMPGPSWGISPHMCHRGSVLHKQAGTICSGCYARAGRYMMPATVAAMERRYKCSFNESWIEAMVFRLKDEPVMRWMDAGDVDERILGLIMEVCRQTPDTRHWIATRERTLVAEYLKHNEIPPNVCIRISADFIDQTDKLPWVDGCTVSTVTRDHKVEGAFNCPVTWSDDPEIDSCDKANCRACWEVPHVNYRLHSENQHSAFFSLTAEEMDSLNGHIAEDVPEIDTAAIIEPIELTDDEVKRMRVGEILALFRSRLEQIYARVGFVVQYAIGREILFFTNLISRVEPNSERRDKALTRMRDIYDEYKIPHTTAQLWKRVVACFDPSINSGQATMEMLKEIGIGKLDVLVSLNEINDDYWRFGDDGAVLLSDEITEGPFDVRDMTIDDLKDLRKFLLEDNRQRETPFQINVAARDTSKSPTTGGSTGFALQRLITDGQMLNAAPPEFASATDEFSASVDSDLEGAIPIMDTINAANGPSEILSIVRIVNGTLEQCDSSTGTYNIVPISLETDAYAILQSPSDGDGSLPLRKLVWFDELTGNTFNFDLV